MMHIFVQCRESCFRSSYRSPITSKGTAGRCNDEYIKLRATDAAPQRVTRHTWKVLSMKVQMNLLSDNIIVASTGKAFFCGFSSKECSPTGRIAIILPFSTHLHLGTPP